jgi:homoserine O-acetyltransferase
MFRDLLCCLFCFAAAAAAQTAPAEHQKNYPDPRPGDYIAHNFTFKSGESLPEVRIHYYTLGTPQRDANGLVRNAVLILHGTGGSGRQFFGSPASSANFAEQLFGPGQLLDAGKYFIVMPDNVGHGGSSKPSDGLRMKFPHYDYDDMVRLQHGLLAEGLGVNHLRLVMGTSMGCMHTWMWGERNPDFMDALMPLACLPIPISGRNRIWRKMLMNSIQDDPQWKNGDYQTEPPGLTNAIYLLIIAGSSPLQMQKAAPTPELADKYLAERVETYRKIEDANDLLYAVASSRDYDPSHDLEKIQAPVMYINSADDFINPPELGIAQQEIKRVKKGRFVLLPITDETRGHGTHTVAKVWQQYLRELLDESD